MVELEWKGKKFSGIQQKGHKNFGMANTRLRLQFNLHFYFIVKVFGQNKSLDSLLCGTQYAFHFVELFCISYNV